MAKLGDVCEIVSGSTPKTSNEAFWNGEFCWITPAEISDSDVVIYDTERKITEMGVNSCALTLMPIGTVLLSSRAPIGKVAITGKEMYCNQGFKNLICSDSIFNKYLFYFLKNNNRYLNSLGRGATFKEISKKIVSDIEIPLPPLETQRQIASNLDKVTHTIDLCNAILEKLDMLVKSRFVEMFGEPVSNSKCWSTVPLGELTTKIGSGATPKGGRESYGTEGISLIRSMNVHNGYFEYKELAHISDEQAEKLDNVTIHKRDVLLNITGASVARCCIVPSDVLPARVNQHVCIIRCKKEVLPIFVCGVLTDDNYQKHLWEIAGSGATREAITKQQIENLSMIVPPLDLQEQFATFIEQTDKSKSAVKQVLEKAETLKKALMQEYFG